MKKLCLLLLLSLPAWAQKAKPSDLLIRYFSNLNQRIEIKGDTLWVYWYEAANNHNLSEFRDTSAIDLKQIVAVKIIKGRNAAGKRGMGIQIYPMKESLDKTIKKANQIDAQQLSQTNTASLAQKLQGQVAGVQIGNDNSPGGGAMVRIHGIGSINANGPLYVIDGVPLQGNINTINPNDVSSVQVLKDPSQTALYGVRGANGVILISTIKGQDNPVVMPGLTLLPLTIWSWGALSKEMHQERAENRIKDWLEGK
jgi:TonB-dependent SusC/RagA subfamily outer membrane receptor